MPADRLPGTAIYPVTLPLSEATEGIIITLAQIINDKRTLYPKLPGLRISLEYNTPQKLDRVIRCMIACHNLKEEWQNGKHAEGT